ncbi:MAG TPA: hypothetical protein VFY06_09055 [Verrucomicrobiae bacterium]|nr:hypothetical protein [Verrucomicrobiae bacterium]
MNDSNREAPTRKRRENLNAFRLGWVLFMVLATSLPYLLDFFNTPAGGHYTWILPPYPEDSFGYMAWAQQAAQGHLLFQLKFTALPNSPFLFNPFFLAAGWLSHVLGGNIGFTLFLLKEIGVVCFLLAFFKYIDYLGLNRIQSVVATVLVGVSSGLGGLLVWLGLGNPATHFSGDLWVVDMNTFWSLLWNPLFPWSLTLMLLALFRLDRGSRDGRNSDFYIGGAITGALALVHPYSQPLLFSFAVLVTLPRQKAKALGCLFRFFAAALPFVIYVGLVVALNPLVSRHDQTGEMISPSPASYALGFGLPLLLAIVGLLVEREKIVNHFWPVLLWFALSAVLAYFPFWFQRKLIFGAHIPLCIIAAISLDLLLNRISNSRTRGRVTVAGAAILLPLLVTTPIYLLANENRDVRANTDGYYYVSHDVMDGLQFLKTETKPGAVVFARIETSRLIPGLAGNTVVWGHWAQTVDMAQRQNWITNLFNPHADWTNPDRARQFWSTNIQYLFADGPLKQSVEQGSYRWQVILNDADEVFTNRSVVIYRHRR